MREAVVRFAEAMEAKLKVHDDRPGWEGDDPEALYDRLIDELKELREAMDRRSEDVTVDVSGECADVANFAMMIFDVTRLWHRRVTLEARED